MSRIATRSRALDAISNEFAREHSDRLWKQLVVAREADAGRLTPELQAWCKQRLQRHEFPHIVEYTDELPKTTTGKIQRYKLRGTAS